MEHARLAVLVLLLVGSAYSQSRENLKDSTKEIYTNRALGVSFQYEDFVNFIDTSYPIPLRDWKIRTDLHLGLSFRSPRPYTSRWERRDYWLWKPATDSVLTMDFGGGATVEIYQTTKSFAEIAFAEGFQQYRGDTTDPFPTSEWDSLVQEISDSNWIFRGLSGIPGPANLLNSTHWNGLRIQTDTRVSLPEQSTTGIADAYISVLVRATSRRNKIVAVYRMYPDDDSGGEDEHGVQRLSESGFYDLVASMRFTK